MAKFELRNATYNRWGGIDVEWNHPQYGWIPFTANPDDGEEHGREIHALLLASGNVADHVPDPEVEARVQALMETPPIEDRITALEARLAALEAKVKK